jgi:hypothetical protein
MEAVLYLVGAPDNKFLHQPGIMLGTLELHLKFTKGG